MPAWDPRFHVTCKNHDSSKHHVKDFGQKTIDSQAFPLHKGKIAPSFRAKDHASSKKGFKVGKAGRQSEKAETLQHSREWETTATGYDYQKLSWFHAGAAKVTQGNDNRMGMFEQGHNMDWCGQPGITDWLRLAGTSGCHLVQLPTSSRATKSRLPRTMSRQLLNISKAKQPQLPQPLLIRLVLQTLHQLRCPSLDTLQHLNVSLVVRGPKLNTVFKVRPHQCQVQGDNRFPSPAGHAISDTSQDAIGLLGHLGTLLAHIQEAVNQHPQVLFHRPAFQPLFPKPVALHGAVAAQVQDLALGLVEPHTIGPSPSIQPVQIPLQSLPTLKQINTPTQLGVICKLTESALDPFVQIIDKDIKHNWPQHRALGNTACDRPPTGKEWKFKVQTRMTLQHFHYNTIRAQEHG
ncbi:hypothetical protein QYF61_020440 [Mycteria americana]|uniref:Uncharacterized protein n=1 Tax=Mycteria americana TaxID=33587 RepID=A0AAN7NUR6_MYCAM|nr:hypothetical protein QYF61_020440 [Mycteria americana]